MRNNGVNEMHNNEERKSVKYFKYNQDDILEILTEYIAKEHGYGTFYSKAELIGSVGKDLRLVMAVGTLDEDESVEKVDLEQLDKNMDFNGSHK